MVFTTFRVFRSTTATWLALGIVTSSQRPSRVAPVPYPGDANGTQVFTAFVAVSITANCGLVWSEVKTMRSSFEIEMRWVDGEIGMTVIVLRAFISSTETVPGFTLAV